VPRGHMAARTRGVGRKNGGKKNGMGTSQQGRGDPNGMQKMIPTLRVWGTERELRGIGNEGKNGGPKKRGLKQSRAKRQAKKGGVSRAENNRWKERRRTFAEKALRKVKMKTQKKWGYFYGKKKKEAVQRYMRENEKNPADNHRAPMEEKRDRMSRWNRKE